MPSAATPSASAWRPELKWAGVLLGMALGGFFDGILLHQILQWDHLLSAVEGQPWLDLRMQLVADGLFHVLTYAVLAAGLVLLYKARQDFALDRADRYLLATTLIGFGAWNVLDSIVFHWVMQIHHIRMDAASPLLWDLAWFMVFGVLFLLLGYRMRRGAGRPGGAASGHDKAAAASLALLVGAAVWQAALAPAAGSDDALVVFRPGVTSAQASMRLAGSMARWCEPTAPVRCGRSSWTHRKMPAPCTAAARCWSALPPSPWAAFPGPGRWSW